MLRVRIITEDIDTFIPSYITNNFYVKEFTGDITIDQLLQMLNDFPNAEISKYEVEGVTIGLQVALDGFEHFSYYEY